MKAAAMTRASGLLPRRRFLQTAGAAIALAGAPRILRGEQPRAKNVVVDTHVHCFAGAEDTRFPYHARAPYRPEPSATPEHLLATMDGAGVDYAVIVHPEPYQDDHRYLEHCLEVGQGRLKGTCLFFADQPGWRERLPELSRRIPLVTARIHAYAPDRLPPFGKPELREYWRAASESGLAVQLHFEPRYAPGFEPLLKEFRDTTVIIDHLGRPFQGTPEEHAVVRRWSRFPHTVIKLSSLQPREQYPHRDIGPIVRQLIDDFGPRRMIYGGGYNAQATPGSYRAYRQRATSYIGHLGEAEQALVLGGNAARLFGFRDHA